MQVRYALRIPYGLSLLAHHDPAAAVRGLEEFPRADRPPVRIVHWAFDLMVASGVAMLAVAAWAGWLAWRRRRLPDHPWLLRSLVAAAPLGFVAIEAGWTVTEVGRQPWIIQGVMRTRDAVTPMPGLVVPFALFTLVYLVLAAILALVLRRQFRETAPPAPP
jgi:cytochrome d ubiquinol oxidase subunit I